MKNQLTETTLANGLKVFLKEIHTAPIISSWLWYRVGSRDEVQGKTGISHWGRTHAIQRHAAVPRQLAR
jgi:zinc protease